MTTPASKTTNAHEAHLNRVVNEQIGNTSCRGTWRPASFRQRGRSVCTGSTWAIFGCGYAAEPDILIEQVRKDEAIAEADALSLTIPNQPGVAYNVHVMEAILTTVAPVLGWR
jgi:hypothetical protein